MYSNEFRRALTHAINRDRINDVVNLGLAKPRQFALSAESPEFQSEEGKAFYEQWVNSYIEYDPDTAMSLLDSIGVVDADGDGLRDRPDGTALDVIVDVPSGDQSQMSTMDLIKQDWDAIGLNTTLNVQDWAIITAFRRARPFHAHTAAAGDLRWQAGRQSKPRLTTPAGCASACITRRAARKVSRHVWFDAGETSECLHRAGHHR
jgi:ABC-type transport system substrate-binding protein